jgi:hypothetical protein
MLNSQDIDIIRNVVIEVLEPRLLASENNIEKRVDVKLVAMEHRITTNLENKIDEKIDELALITKHGFDEVHARLDNIEIRLERLGEIVLPTGYSVAAA